MEGKNTVDDFLNDFQSLADIAARRKPSSVDAGAILRSISALEPLRPVADRAPGVRVLVGFSTAIAAASVVVVACAASAWVELNDPFLAMDTFINMVGFLK
jgi:hypothetical protein